MSGEELEPTEKKDSQEAIKRGECRDDSDSFVCCRCGRAFERRCLVDGLSTVRRQMWYSGPPEHCAVVAACGLGRRSDPSGGSPSGAIRTTRRIRVDL